MGDGVANDRGSFRHSASEFTSAPQCRQICERRLGQGKFCSRTLPLLRTITKFWYAKMNFLTTLWPGTR